METDDNYFYRMYHYINYDLQDWRTAHLPLMMRPFTLILMLVIYNFGCIKYGPLLMKNRKPFELRNVMIVFDLFQIIINIYLFFKSLQLGWWGEFNLFCAEVEYDDIPRVREIAIACYIYFLVKVSDILDTVFMVLRKKNRHISFLHMYHHTGMIILSYINSKFIPGGHHTCVGLYNTFVHVVMYAYYLSMALYPNMNMYSFKKLVTKLQMMQFGLIALHLSTTLMVPNCNYPKWIHVGLLPQNLLMFFLFYDFYRNTYVLKKNVAKRTDEGHSIKSNE